MSSRSDPRRVRYEGRLGVRSFDRFLPIRQDEPYKDRQGNWKQAWPYNVKGNGKHVCHHTDKMVEGTSEESWEDRASNKCRRVVGTAKEEGKRRKGFYAKRHPKKLPGYFGHDNEGAEGFFTRS